MKVLICTQVFHKKFPKSICHIYLISSFHYQCSYFAALRHYVSYVIKQMCEICDKNISKGKYEKLRNYLFKACVPNFLSNFYFFTKKL